MLLLCIDVMIPSFPSYMSSAFLVNCFWKSAYNRFVANLNEREILFRCQFCFRKLHSISMALKTLRGELTKCPDSNEYIIGLFIGFLEGFWCSGSCYLTSESKVFAYGVRGESNTNGDMLLILVYSACHKTRLYWIHNYLGAGQCDEQQQNLQVSHSRTEI